MGTFQLVINGATAGMSLFLTFLGVRILSKLRRSSVETLSAFQRYVGETINDIELLLASNLILLGGFFIYAMGGFFASETATIFSQGVLFAAVTLFVYTFHRWVRGMG